MIGVILAGGKGTRLFPLTTYINKHLLNVNFQPLIHYPLMDLMAAGFKDLVIITNPNDLEVFSKLLGNGKNLGIKISYISQKSPGGLPHAIYSAKRYLLNRSFVVILGDIFFDQNNFKLFLNKSLKNFKNKGSHIFLSKVKDGRDYGTVKIKNNKIIGMIEKPLRKKLFGLDLAINGVYIFDDKALNYIAKLSPSERGELEMVDLLEIYNSNNQLTFSVLSNKDRWYDSGNMNGIIMSSNNLEKIKNSLLTPEYLAFKNGWISKKKFKEIISSFPESYYKKHNIALLQKLI